LTTVSDEPASQSSTKLLPMKPAPPVTRIVIFLIEIALLILDYQHDLNHALATWKAVFLEPVISIHHIIFLHCVRLYFRHNI